jgi:hypothetical protein
MTAPRENEGRACHAVVRVLESINGGQHSNVRHPEKMNGMPPIDLLFDLGNKTFAQEHTIIEPFIHFTRAEHDFQSFANPIRTAFEGRLPIEGVVRVACPADTRIGRDNLVPTQAAIIDWIRKTALRLATEVPSKGTRNSPVVKRQTETRVFSGLTIHLTRDLHWNRSATFDGTVTLSRYVGEDVETRRRERISDALSRKLQKLHDAKEQAGVTVLVLENTDIALTNEILISQALQSCFVDPELVTLRPDAIYQVDTFTDEWFVYGTMIVPGRWLHETYQHDSWDFPQNSLRDIRTHMTL